MHILVSLSMSLFWDYSLQRSFLGSVMHGHNENILRPLGLYIDWNNSYVELWLLVKKMLILLSNASWTTHYFVMTSLCPPFTRLLDMEHQKKSIMTTEGYFSSAQVSMKKRKVGNYRDRCTINKDYDDNIRTSLKKAKPTFSFVYNSMWQVPFKNTYKPTFVLRNKLKNENSMNPYWALLNV